MVRAEIKVQSVMGDLRKAGDLKEWDYFVDKENKIAYIRLVAFSETATEEMAAAIKKCKEEKVRGLVLDLRNNPGGLLRAAVEISNMFVNEGSIVSTRGRNHKTGDAYDADPAKVLLPADQCPMVVLVNKYSASASEIVAAALQDHQRAIVIGERSFGKGSVQNVIPMEGQTSALKLTTASYWRPSGKNIHRFPDSKETDDWGVKPNDSGFKLTSQSMSDLRKDGVPDAILAKLKDFPAKRFATEKEYVEQLEKSLSGEEVKEYLEKLMDRADRGYEVPMKDEERLDYMIYRRDRDVVHGKDGVPVPPKPKSEKDKDKKPFEDRVLQKALEYLRGAIKKAEAARPEAADA